MVLSTHARDQEHSAARMSTVVLPGISAAAARFLELVEPLSADWLRAPSQLPDWTRSHVVVHVAGICAALSRQIECARNSQQIELYDGGYQGRMAGIEEGVQLAPEQQKDRLRRALGRVLAAVTSVTEEQWSIPVKFRNGTVMDCADAVWRELEIHAVDLGLSASSIGWSSDFCRRLINFLEARVPEGERFALQPLQDAPVTLGCGATGTAIGGSLQDLAVWLAGRPPVGVLSATVAGGSVGLPPLSPWPSGVKPA